MEIANKIGPGRLMLGKIVFLAFLLIAHFTAKPALAQETVFGPEDLRIGWFHVHLSFHKFMADESGEGNIIISKITPEKKIRGGFARLNGEWIPLQSFLRGDTSVFEKRINFRTRNYLVVLLRGNRGASVNVEVRKKILTPPPEINFSAYPTAIKSGDPSELRWQVSYAETVGIDPGIGTVEASGSLTVSPSETTTYILEAEGKGGTATRGATVTVYQPPTVTLSADPETVTYGETTILHWSSTDADKVLIDQNIGEVSNEGFLEVKPNRTTTYTVTAGGLGGSRQAQVVVTVKAKVEPQPEGSFGGRYEELIPPDATIEAYDSKRFSVVTGLVHEVNGLPIADVSVILHNHPEYGTGFTDGEGRFSLPVEGGGTITLVYQKDGFITAHRKVYVPWNDTAVAETIKMIAEDPVATTISFDGNPDTVFTHQSTEVSDEFGTRSCSMVFTGDNQAYEVDGQGTVIRELSEITTRATEFPTPESMPAVLPATSAYTYCAELSVDGVQRVKFDKPVITWVVNFLGFDVGELVPVGYYDRDKGVWVPSDNGVVVRLLDTDSDGIVDGLDSNGDEAPNDLDGDGVFSDEVLGLDDSFRYPAGATFWRAELTHFTSVDWNWPPWPMFAEADPDPNPAGPPIRDGKLVVCRDCLSPKVGSFVEERSRIFHEDISIPGTDITLHYSSDRVQGYRHKITVSASGETVPTSLKRIIVRLEVAGRSFQQTLDPLPNQMAEFVWDGLDHLGRQVRGATIAHVSLGFVYDAVYSRAANLVQAFGQPGREATLISARQELVSWERSNIVLPSSAKKDNILAEGWTLSPHHYLNPTDTSILHKGDGTQAVNQAITVDTIAGGGSGYTDGVPATEVYLSVFEGMDVDATGNVYIANRSLDRVLKVDSGGIITSVVGNGSEGFSGDGGPATQAKLNKPKGVALDSEGNIYIADTYNLRIRKVDKNGIVTTIAGNGTQTYAGEGVPATQTGLKHPVAVAVDDEGNVYISDWHGHRVFKVDTNGIITTVAGNGIAGFSGDGGPASQARIAYPGGLAVDARGNLYVASYWNRRIRKVDTRGIITTVAGNGNIGYSGDGGPATEAGIGEVYDVALDRGGNLYIADTWSDRVRKVDSSGTIITYAGDGTWGFSGDGGPATQAQFKDVYGVALDPLGNLYIIDGYDTYRVRKVSLPYVLFGSMEVGDIAFAEENGLGHILSGSGQHKTTIDVDTGIVLREFGYDEENRLVSITDQFGNQTIINRDGSGVPTSITSPDGITTTLTVDENNHLTRITYPDGNFYSFEYTDGGLLTSKAEPEGNLFGHGFDSTGRLTTVTDEEEGIWQYTRTALESGEVLTEVLTGEGDLTSYVDFTDSTGAYTSTITDPTGSVTSYSQSGDGLTVNKSLPCGMDLDVEYGLDSEYKFKFVKEMKETTPAGLTKSTLRNNAYQDTNADEIPDRITERVTVNSKTTTLVTNTLQATRTITSPAGRSVTTNYDPNNLLTTTLSIPGLFDTSYGYDMNGRLTSIATNMRQTTFTYNAQGFLESITDPEDHTTTYSRDAVGRLTAISRPDTSSVAFTYDKNGNMTVLTNPASVEHGFGYNLVNLNSSYSTPLSGSYSYLYDRDRRLSQVNFPSGKQINNFYADGNLVQIQTPEGDVNVAYSCSTKVDSITKGLESIFYDYDGSLVTAETSSGTLNACLDYTYNNDFNLTTFTYAGGTVGYTYDSDGLLTSSGAFNISRNAGNGLPESVTGGALKLSRSFNGYGEVEGQNFTVGVQGVSSWNLIRDNAGRIMSKTETVDGATSNYDYTYDPMGRLLTVNKDGNLVEEYQYDSVGTRTYEMNLSRGIAGRTFTYDDEDHLLTVGDTGYQYDLDGYLTTKTIGTEPPYEVTTYAYSSRGELLSVSLPGGTLVEYIHDPLGRRIAKKVNGAITEKYLWQGLTRLLAVYGGSDNLLMRFLYADSRMPVAMEKGAALYYLSYDQVGSLRVVADGFGNVVKRIDYDSFGNVINDTNPSFAIPFGFAGGLHDHDTDLVRFGFRDYDPDTGRWTAKDPIGFLGGDVDLYGYCLNDPINWVDPRGQFGGAGLVVGIFAGAYGGFLAGVQQGDILTGVFATVTGAAVGGLVGIIAPHLSATAGAMVGGAIGGMAGAALSVYRSNPCPSPLDYSKALLKGGVIGGLTGFMGGGMVASAASIGATGAAAHVSAAMFTAPVGWGLSMIDF